MPTSLPKLAELLRRRNEIDEEIARLIRRPALLGHLGEYIASRVFDIELESSAATKSHDGKFVSGPLQGKTVNVKYYGKRDGFLDLRADAVPDYFLVLTGPGTGAGSSVGAGRPFVIEEAFLFDGPRLVRDLQGSLRPPKIGIATSVRRELWDGARVFPVPAGGCPLPLTEECAARLRLFAPT